MEEIDKLTIADEMLEVAIENYLDNERYFSAIHLAGAAQENYGKWIRINKGQNFSTLIFEQADKAFKDQGESLDRKAIKKSEKHSKNTIKHLDNHGDRYALLDPVLDAFMQISEAVVDNAILQREETSNLKRFKEHVIQTKNI